MKTSLPIYLVIAMTHTQFAHVSNRFRFVVHAPLSQASALFGAEGERCWAGPDWNPEFLHPQPARDIQGAVFTVQHGQHKSVWVNTLFRPAEGRMQYVAFVPGKLVSTVDVRLTELDRSGTAVEVTYTRTALDITANDDVEGMGKSDQESGPRWQASIEQCLKGQRAP
jgi:hypothetical protein